MFISDSSIQLSSEHIAIDQHRKIESLNVWRGGRPSAEKRDSQRKSEHADRGRHHGQTDRIDFSQHALQSRSKRAIATPVDEKDQNSADLNIKILREMIQRLTGKIIDVKLPQDLASQNATVEQTADFSDQPVPSQNGLGLEYDYYESHYEYESTSFAAQGVVTTKDGMRVDFNVQLNMTREFMQEQRVSIRAGDALKDPLAVNYSGNAAELTQTSFSFDIDTDGRDNQVAFTSPGSGFLALDKNEDGIINNGSELFGPTSGDGFAELASYDEDGNDWIDENDSIFEHLRIWTKNNDGENQLFSLGEKGIGAIYLNHIQTPFSIKSDNNELLGQVRDTGIFLKEDGTTGTIQQIDLAV